MYIHTYIYIYTYVTLVISYYDITYDITPGHPPSPRRRSAGAAPRGPRVGQDSSKGGCSGNRV